MTGSDDGYTLIPDFEPLLARMSAMSRKLKFKLRHYLCSKQIDKYELHVIFTSQITTFK